jgi:hypothetical protein
MGVSYDVFTQAFLMKVTEYDFLGRESADNEQIVDGYMKRAISEFKKICKYDLTSTADDELREFFVSIPDEDIDELANIISEGMLVQWLKPYLYRQENLQNVLNTKDFTSYSPAELLNRIRESYEMARKNYISMMREYSYDHGDLASLHL